MTFKVHNNNKNGSHAIKTEFENAQNHVTSQKLNSQESVIQEIVNHAVDNHNTIQNQTFEENLCNREVTLTPIYNNKLCKPSRPAVKSASELFEMFKQPEQSWKCLTLSQQRFYYNALRTIKRNYINSYEKYLYSLSIEDLYLLHQDTLKEN